MPDPSIYDIEAGDEPTAAEQARALAQQLRGRRTVDATALLGQSDLLRPAATVDLENANQQESQLASAGQSRASNRLQAGAQKLQGQQLLESLRKNRVDEGQQQQRIGLERANQEKALFELQHHLDEENEGKLKDLAGSASKFAPFDEEWGNLTRLLGVKPGDDLLAENPKQPGVGILEGRLPAILKSDAGKQYTQAVNRLQLKAEAAFPGAMKSTGMQGMVANALSLDPTVNNRSRLIGLMAMKNLAETQKRALAAEYQPHIRQAFAARNPGVDFPVELNQAQPAQAATKHITAYSINKKDPTMRRPVYADGTFGPPEKVPAP